MFIEVPTTLTKAEFDELQIKDLIPMRCKNCHQEFNQTKNIILKSLRKYGKCGYCSRLCCNKAKINHSYLPCEECGKITQKSAVALKTNKHVFCSCSCHAKYKNRHKNFGKIRSKMEEFIESKVKEFFPTLEFYCNDRKSLNGPELDFLFPSLKLAVELNGITHYEPIYGKDRLTRSQESDRRKMSSCEKIGIELAVIDISSIKYFKPKCGLKIFHEIEKILRPLLAV
jgi:very-short-patch-repair endonuclease